MLLKFSVLNLNVRLSIYHWMSTEYRDSYCWFHGGPKHAEDHIDKLVKTKIDGTYQQPPPKVTPEFQFEQKQKDKRARVLPNPQNVVAANSNKAPRKSIVHVKEAEVRKQREKKKSKHHTSTFTNYGEGNTHPTNPDLYMTTYNVKAPEGVNPYTLMKAALRPYIAAEYAQPRPITAVRMHQPRFYKSMKEMPRDEQLQMDGPFWVHWPSDKPFPQAYAELEEVVRQKRE